MQWYRFVYYKFVMPMVVCLIYKHVILPNIIGCVRCCVFDGVCDYSMALVLRKPTDMLSVHNFH